MKIILLTVFITFIVLFGHVELSQSTVTNFSEDAYPWWDVEGDISQKDFQEIHKIADKLLPLMSKSKPQNNFLDFNQRPTFRLNSTGGDIEAAIGIGRLLRKMSAMVVVPIDGKCYSACVFIVAGGVTRILGDDMIGIHRPYSTRTDERDYATVQAEYNRIAALAKSYLQGMNVSPALYDAMVAVPPDKLRILSHSELVEFGLNETDPVYQEIEDASEAKSYNLSMPLYLSRKAEVDDSCSHIRSLENPREYYNCKQAIMYGLSISEFVRRDAMVRDVCVKKFPSRRDSEEKMAKFRLCRSQIIEGSRK